MDDKQYFVTPEDDDLIILPSHQAWNAYRRTHPGATAEHFRTFGEASAYCKFVLQQAGEIVRPKRSGQTTPSHGSGHGAARWGEGYLVVPSSGNRYRIRLDEALRCFLKEGNYFEQA